MTSISELAKKVAFSTIAKKTIKASDIKAFGNLKPRTEYVDKRIKENTTTLLKNKWLSLENLVSEENNVGGYVYSSETRCSGHIVAVLPYVETDEGRLYLLREEVTPPWNLTEKCLSSITGGCEENSTPEEDACRELAEEASIQAKPGDLINLGLCRGSKSSDSIYHLFAIDVTGVGDPNSYVSGPGDGALLEEMASNAWYRFADLVQGEDPMLNVLVNRLLVLE